LCEEGEIFTTFSGEGHLLTKKMIQAEKIETYENLMHYIKRHYELPCELELYDEAKKILLTETSRLFPKGASLSVQVLFRHIRNVNKNDVPIKNLPYDEFFKQRHINLINGIYRDAAFEKCVQRLKCDFKLSPEILQDFKFAVWHTLIRNEASKSSLIKRVLEIAVRETPFFYIQEQYEVKVNKHKVKADRATIQTLTQRVICIGEDKFSERDLEEGVVQCFDQTRTYSLTEDGMKFPFVYGIATNFNEWRFLCYRPPQPGAPTTYNNFYVSETFTLMKKSFKIEDKEARQELINVGQKLEALIGIIQGFLCPDIDITVIDTLGLVVDKTDLQERIKKQLRDEEVYTMQLQTDLELIGFSVNRKKLHIEDKPSTDVKDLIENTQ